MPVSKKIIVANWKMNPETVREARAVGLAMAGAPKMKKISLVICPPYPFLAEVAAMKKFVTGSQDVSYESGGAFTGEVGSKMIKSLGASFAIVGHSERRSRGESSEIVAQKVKRCLEVNLCPILCIGEKERDGEAQFFETIQSQLRESLALVQRKELKKIIIAYEPIWAIGSKSAGAMEPELIKETLLFIRKTLYDMAGPGSVKDMKILYGGSVDFRNAESILKDGAADGLLVGRESLVPKNFIKLLEACSK